MRRNSKHRRILTARTKLSALVLSFATLAVGGAAWAGAPQTSTEVVVDALSVSAASSGELTATAKVHSPRTMRVQALTVAVRSSNGSHFDFPGATGRKLSPSQTTFTTGGRAFPAGTYTAFVAYKYHDTWHNLSPVKTFTSGDTTTSAPGTTPTASASPSPTPTASASTSPSPTSSPTASGSATPSPSQTTPTTGAAPLGIPGTWRQVFGDEFNGTSLDTSKWNPNWLGCPTCTTKPVNSSELGAYAPSQVSVSGGSLHLKAEKQQTTASDGKTYAYRSGLVESDGKAQFTYGAFEARIYTPASGTQIANWPAFWTDGQNWPEDGEMDVMEGLSGRACYHFHSTAGGPGGCAPGDFTGWHTYGAEWKPGSVTYYYDGKQVGQITTGITSSPMFLILNNGVSTEHGGPIVTPADMMTDYVRVWQH